MSPEDAPELQAPPMQILPDVHQQPVPTPRTVSCQLARKEMTDISNICDVEERSLREWRQSRDVVVVERGKGGGKRV